VTPAGSIGGLGAQAGRYRPSAKSPTSPDGAKVSDAVHEASRPYGVSAMAEPSPGWALREMLRAAK